MLILPMPFAPFDHRGPHLPGHEKMDVNIKCLPQGESCSSA